MRISDTLYFSPKHAFRDLDFTNADRIARAFHDRVDGFYLIPAERLIASQDAFATGLIIMSVRMSKYINLAAENSISLSPIGEAVKTPSPSVLRRWFPPTFSFLPQDRWADGGCRDPD
jgi:hypothetical protein